jgi:hypothetical protein
MEVQQVCSSETTAKFYLIEPRYMSLSLCDEVHAVIGSYIVISMVG